MTLTSKEMAIRKLKRKTNFSNKIFNMFRNDKDVALVAVEGNGLCLNLVSKMLKADFDVALTALKNTPYCIDFVAEELLDNPTFAKEVLSIHPKLKVFFSDEVLLHTSELNIENKEQSMLKSKAAEILEKKNQIFLDGVQKILGDNWTIKIEVVDIKFGTDFNQSISFHQKLSNNRARGFSTNFTGALQLNDAVFDKLIDGMNKMNRIPDDAYIQLKGRSSISLANQLQESLSKKASPESSKRIKI